MKNSTLAKYLAPPRSAPELARRTAAPEAGQFHGAKSGAGVWQTIINQIPPHDTFIEAFVGTATITRLMRPAAARIVIDSDAAVCQVLRARFSADAGVTVVCADAVAWLEKHRGKFTRRTVIYCDPPYLFSVRSTRRVRYGQEFGQEWLHGELLAVLSRIACQEVPVLLSGYRSELYDRMIGHWRRIDYRAMTHGGVRLESLWCSHDEPDELHDWRYLGRNYRERLYLRRLVKRWLARLDAMPARKRGYVLDAIVQRQLRRGEIP